MDFRFPFIYLAIHKPMRSFHGERAIKWYGAV